MADDKPAATPGEAASTGHPVETPPPAPAVAQKASTFHAGEQAPAPSRPRRRWWLWIVAGVGLAAALIFGVPWVKRSLNTVSTDDAYVNGRVTFVAPRVSGQVSRVL